MAIVANIWRVLALCVVLATSVATACPGGAGSNFNSAGDFIVAAGDVTTQAGKLVSTTATAPKELDENSEAFSPANDNEGRKAA